MTKVPDDAYRAVEAGGDTVEVTEILEATEAAWTTETFEAAEEAAEAGVSCGEPARQTSESQKTASAPQGKSVMKEVRKTPSYGNPASGHSWQERTELLIGEDALCRLRSATVVVAGLGGVGAYAAEMVVRAGVGSIIIIDSDQVSVSNKNRQLLAMDSSLGRQKTEVMAARLRDINPELKIVEVDEYLTENNIATVLEKACAKASAAHDSADGDAGQAVCASIPEGSDASVADPAANTADNTVRRAACSKTGATSYSTGSARPDFLIDAIDTLAPKIALLSYCYRSGIPLVSSMGSGAKFDATKVRLTDLSKSYNCPLAFMIRKRLRKEGISKGFQVVFSEELPDREAIVATEGERNKKSQVGTISYLPAVFGCVCAQAAIMHLVGGQHRKQ